MKKLIALTAVAAAATVSLNTTPAHAAGSEWFDKVSCTYSNPNPTPAFGNLKVTEDGAGRFDVVGTINDDQGNRLWDWTMYHDGEVSATGTPAYGSRTVSRTMLDFPGADKIRFRMFNVANGIECNAYVTTD